MEWDDTWKWVVSALAGALTSAGMLIWRGGRWTKGQEDHATLDLLTHKRLEDRLDAILEKMAHAHATQAAINARIIAVTDRMTQIQGQMITEAAVHARDVHGRLSRIEQKVFQT